MVLQILKQRQNLLRTCDVSIRLFTIICQVVENQHWNYLFELLNAHCLVKVMDVGSSKRCKSEMR